MAEPSEKEIEAALEAYHITGTVSPEQRNWRNRHCTEYETWRMKEALRAAARVREKAD